VDTYAGPEWAVDGGIEIRGQEDLKFTVSVVECGEEGEALGESLTDALEVFQFAEEDGDEFVAPDVFGERCAMKTSASSNNTTASHSVAISKTFLIFLPEVEASIPKSSACK
jgi:hypothetical protein